MKTAAGMVCLALSTALLVSCATTKLTTLWKDSDPQNNKLTKIAVFGLAKEMTSRRLFEDEFVQRLKSKGVSAESSYKVVPDDVDRGDIDKIAGLLKEKGFDGAIVSRVKEIKKDEKYVPPTVTTMPGTYYSSFASNYAIGYHDVVTPGYVVEETKVIIETNVFNLNTSKLIVSGISETVQPGSVGVVIKGVARTIIKELKKGMFI